MKKIGFDLYYCKKENPPRFQEESIEKSKTI